jgi:hypothetical protein
LRADDEEAFEHFRVRGWIRVRAAFSGDEAEVMRAATWRALARVGISDGDPSTWTKERPDTKTSSRPSCPSWLVFWVL